ncbi:MAG: type II toxin-antitoxin system PemK/MazF family toxin [Chloroflexi bacterium]|nr:type II toxin-antitoxin system PemK/MazF family toxin [Chloroflexota bacterium]
MPPTTSFSRGDVVLVNFVFSSQEGVKRRPALLVSSATYHQGRQEVILVAITSNVHRLLPGDTALVGWQKAGLLRPSTVTGVLRTVKTTALARRLGAVPSPDLRAVEASLRLALAL